MITRQLMPFFLSNPWVLFIGISRFCISRPSKFHSMKATTFWIMFWLILSVKHTFTSQRWRFHACQHNHLFYVKCAKFWYITCFVPILVPIWPSHGLLLLLKIVWFLPCQLSCKPRCNSHHLLECTILGYTAQTTKLEKSMIIHWNTKPLKWVSIAPVEAFCMDFVNVSYNNTSSRRLYMAEANLFLTCNCSLVCEMFFFSVDIYT